MVHHLEKYKHDLLGDYTLFIGYEFILGTHNSQNTTKYRIHVHLWSRDLELYVCRGLCDMRLINRLCSFLINVFIFIHKGEAMLYGI